MNKFTKLFILIAVSVVLILLFFQPVMFVSKQIAKKLLPDNIINALRIIKNPSYQYIDGNDQELNKLKEIISLSDIEEKEAYLNKAFISNEYLVDFYQSQVSLNIIDENNELIKTVNATKFTTSSLSHGQAQKTKSSAYINSISNDDKFIITSKDGVILFLNLNDYENPISHTVPNNLRELITFDEFFSDKRFGIKDASVFDGYLFISFTNKYESNCYNTSIAYSKLNIDFLQFKMLFSPNDCVRSDDPEKQFSANQVGGRIERYSDTSSLLTVGEFRDRPLAQNPEKIFGKILKINYKKTNKGLEFNDYNIIASGIRNSQGLYYDELSNKALFSDHGPDGGDEINLIEDFSKTTNYGWPISSYGEHYYNTPEHLFTEAPFYKSHKDYGFQEPSYIFTPSIAVSELEILKKQNSYDNNILFLSSLGYTEYNHERSIHFFELDQNFKNLKRKGIININERIRDLIIHNNKLFMYLDNSSSVLALDVKEILN